MTSPRPVPIFDGHNDVLLRLYRRGGTDVSRAFLEGEAKGQLDLPMARQGGFVGGLFAIFVPSSDGANGPNDETPSAALTRSGVRKASEIVIFTLRTLHRSRLAMLPVVAVSSAISSSSQRRPRAIDATKVARFSGRIGRACCGDIPSGTRLHGAALILSSAKRPEGRRWIPPSGDRFAVFRQADDQLFWLDLDSRDVSVDQAPVVNLLGWFEMLANRPDDQRLDVGCRFERTDPARSAAPWKRAEDR